MCQNALAPAPRLLDVGDAPASSHKHLPQISSRTYMVRSSSSLVCYMSLLGTFSFSDVIESNHQPQIEVVSCVDLLCAYTLGLSSAIAPSHGCEVRLLPLRNPLH
jgi:hypothetical protein